MSEKSQYIQAAYNELVCAIYDATLDSYEWERFLEKCATATSADAAALWTVSRGGVKKDFFYSYNFDATHLVKYKGGCKLSEVKVSHVVTDEDLQHGEFYSKVLAPQGLSHFAGSIVLKRDEDVVFFGIARSADSGHFNNDEIILTSKILPHIARGLQIDQRLSEINNYRTVCGDLLHRLNVGVILVDSLGKPILLNHKAESLITKTGTGLSIKAGKIRTSNIQQTRDLAELIDSAIRGDTALGDASGAMTIQREDYGCPLRLLIKPIQSSLDQVNISSSSACAIVFIGEDERDIAFSTEDVMSLYGLTQAESRLAISIAKGMSLDETAEHFQLSKNTLRSQLRAIHAKMGIKRQNELVALMLSGPARFNINGSMAVSNFV